MDIQTIYQINNSHNNTVNYQVPKKYENTHLEKPKAKTKPKHKKSYIDDYVTAHKAIPAPNQYTKKEPKFDPSVLKKHSKAKSINFEE